MTSSTKTKSRPLNWAKYTDFRTRNSKEDLANLCANLERIQVKEEFSTPDEAGLCPIHWAAINNRSDLIEFLIDNGSPIKARCKNKLFADGTALHLAAMNGSIEAAAMLLFKCAELQKRQTKPKSSSDGSTQTSKRAQSSEVSDWLESRDLEGQTPLMRSAAPRSKRLDTVRDLLRKNLWSLGGRPAEMALFLINAGADWRQTDSKFGMNLLHWAIANDYDDIVNMLLIIDKQLLNIRARLAPVIEEQRQLKTMTATRATSNQAVSRISEAVDDISSQKDELESVDLNSETSSAKSEGSAGGSGVGLRKPLLAETKRDEFRERLTADGLSPLQLAIVYGRVSVINLLWHSTNNYNSKIQESNSISFDNKQKSSTTRWSRKQELRNIIIRAYWANTTELTRLMRSSLLRLVLAIDLTVLTLVWVPAFLGGGRINTPDYPVACEVKNGAFIIAYCLSLALACRVMLKNPGFLRRSSIQYLSELTHLVGRKAALSSTDRQSTASNKTISNEDKTSPDVEPNGEQNVARTELQTVSDKRQVKVIVPIQAYDIDKTFQAPLNELTVQERVRMLCHKCRCIRRPRSRHCNSCNHCVQEFDHHCIYLGCCVGRENRFDFLLMMIMVSLTAIYGIALYSVSLERQQFGHFLHIIGLIWLAKYILIGVLSSFFILRRACCGVTMFEQIRSNRIRRIFGHNGPSKDISSSHKYYSIKKGSFWRYSPDRFLTGDIPMRKLLSNFRDFTSHVSIGDYFLAMACADTALARSLSSNDSKVDLYKFV